MAARLLPWSLFLPLLLLTAREGYAGEPAPEPAPGRAAVEGWLARPWGELSGSAPAGSLSAEQAAWAAEKLWARRRADLAELRADELESAVVRAAGKEMRYVERRFGRAPEGARSLWISMHGGGAASARINDRQWRNQVNLYEPREGFVVVPRAPTDAWNLWHQGHIDALFDRLIETYVAARGVDPDRVYLMGYSAGGDGVYQLAPRMADRFAAAAMMAGHPNNASPLGLRNLPFMIFMGGEDSAYKRNELAALWGRRLEELEGDDPGGYPHEVTIYRGVGHWMRGKDREALPWMFKHRRDPWPEKVVWHQGPRTHERFYWLALPPGVARMSQTVRAQVRAQTIDVQAEGLRSLRLRLSDQLLDLDRAVSVVVNGEPIFEGRVPRTLGALWASLEGRADPRSVATAVLDLEW